MTLPPVPLAKVAEPLIVHDGQEHWVVYPGDNGYRLLAELPPDEGGVRHTTPELVVRVKGWWYTDAVRKVLTLVESHAIDWEELALTDAEIDNGNTAEFVRKLNRVTGHLVWVSTQLMQVEAELSAARQALELVVDKRLGMEENAQAERPKGSQAMRTALFISSNKPLRTAKITIIERTAQREALERLREALDTQWRTISRAISARAAEPLDR